MTILSQSSNDVRGRCPFCGHDSLFLGSGGYITCRIAECPNPGGITDLLNGELAHIVVLGENSFTIQHPLRERLEGELFNCGLHQHLVELGGPPRVPGRYRVTWDGYSDVWVAA